MRARRWAGWWAGAMVLGLTGCGAAESTGSSNAGSTTPDAAAADNFKSPGPPGQAANLSVPLLNPIAVAQRAPVQGKATDWPQWQGPNRNAIAADTGLLATWPAQGPKLVYSVKGFGEGYTTPSIADGMIFSMGNRDGDEYVMAFDVSDGREVWATPIGKVRSNGGGYPGPRCTPTVDGKLLYAEGLNGDLVCIETGTGKIVWSKDLKKDYGGQDGSWGYCESPLVDGDWVICTPGGKTATLLALDKKTGKEIWKSAVPRGDAAGYASIIRADVGRSSQYIQFLSGGVVGVSRKDGKPLWRYDRPANGTANCSTPIYADGFVFAASGYGTGGGLAKLTPKGSGFLVNEVYFTKNMKNHHGGMVLIDGHIYGSDEGELVCLEFKTGKVKWSNRKPGKGSISAADGKLYYRNEGGPIYLIDANPAKYVERGKFEPAERSGQPAWPHPVIAGGRLYIRDQDMLHVYELKAK